MSALVLLCVIAGLLRSSLGNRNCPDLIVESCHCSAERSKQLSRQQVRVRVVCDDVELMDTLQPSFLPNRTVSLLFGRERVMH
ncbi:Adhesion G protein-coupled receptor A2, partial [Dissostichus eleginoides]